MSRTRVSRDRSASARSRHAPGHPHRHVGGGVRDVDEQHDLLVPGEPLLGEDAQDLPAFLVVGEGQEGVIARLQDGYKSRAQTWPFRSWP